MRAFLQDSLRGGSRAAATSSVIVVAPSLWHRLRTSEPELAELGQLVVFHPEGTTDEYDTRMMKDEEVARLLRSSSFQSLAQTLLKGRFRADTSAERGAILYASPGVIPRDTPAVVVDAGEVSVAFLLDGNSVIWMEEIGPWMRHQPPPARPPEDSPGPPAPQSGEPAPTTVALSELHVFDTPELLGQELSQSEFNKLIGQIVSLTQDELRRARAVVTGSWRVKLDICPEGLSSLSGEDLPAGAPPSLQGTLVKRLPHGWPRTRKATLHFEIVLEMKPRVGG